MAKRRKTKRPASPSVKEQLARTIKTLRELRAWEDHLINELERLSAMVRGDR